MKRRGRWGGEGTKTRGDREGANRFATHASIPAIGKPAAVASSDKSSTWMKRTVHIAGKLEPFFGTLDENVRVLKKSLHVRTHLHDSKLTVEREHNAVAPSVKLG